MMTESHHKPGPAEMANLARRLRARAESVLRRDQPEQQCDLGEPTLLRRCFVKVRATDMVARTNPTGVLIVSFERDGNESNTASVWTASGRGRNLDPGELRRIASRQSAYCQRRIAMKQSGRRKGVPTRQPPVGRGRSTRTTRPRHSHDARRERVGFAPGLLLVWFDSCPEKPFSAKAAVRRGLTV